MITGNAWIYTIATVFTFTALCLQVYLLLYKHSHLSPRAVSSRWCIAASSLGFIWDLLAIVYMGKDVVAPEFLLIPVIIFAVGMSGLCVETIHMLKIREICLKCRGDRL